MQLIFCHLLWKFLESKSDFEPGITLKLITSMLAQLHFDRQNQLSICLHLLPPILGHVKFIWEATFPGMDHCFSPGEEGIVISRRQEFFFTID